MFAGAEGVRRAVMLAKTSPESAVVFGGREKLYWLTVGAREAQEWFCGWVGLVFSVVGGELLVQDDQAKELF